MTKQAIVESFRELGVDDKLDLLHQLWDEIAEEFDTKPATEDEKRFLDRRIQDIDDDPRSSGPWEQIRDDLLADE